MSPPNLRVLGPNDREPVSYSEIRAEIESASDEGERSAYFNSLDKPTQEAWEMLKLFTDRVGFDEFWDHEEVDDWARDVLFDDIRDRIKSLL